MDGAESEDDSVGIASTLAAKSRVGSEEDAPESGMAGESSVDRELVGGWWGQMGPACGTRRSERARRTSQRGSGTRQHGMRRRVEWWARGANLVVESGARTRLLAMGDPRESVEVGRLHGDFVWT